MDLSTVQVSFKDDAGEVQQSRLAVAEAGVLAAGRPWRVFRWHRGQAHYSGWYWSATMGRHVVYESRLELARLLLADFDRQVAAIAAQPFLVTAPAEDGRTRRHVPDFLLVDRGGLVTVVNVKPADRLGDPKVARSLAWAGAVFESRGWRHEIWSQAPPAELANVRFLAAYRHRARVPAELADWVGGRISAPVSIAELEAAWPEQADGIRSAALHLLWRGDLTADLTRPLDAATVLGRAA
jgi:TnsA-like endonuclease N terminal